MIACWPGLSLARKALSKTDSGLLLVLLTGLFRDNERFGGHVGFEIRKWQESDQVACREGFLASYQPLIDQCPEDYRPIVRAVLSAASELAFTDIASYLGGYDRAAAWIAESEGELAGYVDTWSVNDSTARLGNIFVLPGYRRQGLANRLLFTAEGYAKTLSADRLILYSPHPLVEAHQLYLQSGFRVTETQASEARREIVTLVFEKTLS